ncbi:MAG: ankyrin repeat domain-containing protein [Bdellovibrionia bacterium]
MNDNLNFFQIGLPLLILQFTNLVFAGDIKVDHGTDGGVIIRASDCPTLKSEIDSLSEYYHMHSKGAASIGVDCTQTPELTALNVAPLIPSHVHKQYRFGYSCNGPNCFNSSLIDQKLENDPRFTSSAELMSTVQTSCRERKSTDSAHPGDMAIIKKNSRTSSGALTTSPLHAFTYIGNTAFSKNGFQKQHTWTLQPLKTVLSAYKVDLNPECHNTKGAHDTCSVFVSYYQCDPTSLQLKTKNAEMVASHISECVINFNKRKSLVSHVEGLLHSLELIKKDIEMESTLKNQNDHAKAVLSSFNFQAQELMLHSFEQALLDNDVDTIQRNLALWPNLSETEVGINLLMSAIKGNSPNAVKLILERNVNPDTENQFGTTPLWAAAEKGNLPIVQMLVDRKVSLEKSTPTPLWTAAQKGHMEIVKFLLKHGANPSAKDLRGQSVLDQARSYLKKTKPGTVFQKNALELVHLIETANGIHN